MREKNKTNVPARKVLIQLAESRWGDVFAFDVLTQKSYTYGEFFSASLNARDAIQKLSVLNGEAIYMVVNNSFETLILYIGALLSGIRIAAVDSSKGTEDIKTILLQVACKIIIADDPSLSYGRGYTPSSIIKEKLWRTNRTKKEVLESLANIDEEQIYLITFTSGTTGTPKGVMHSFRSLYLSARVFGNQFNFGEGHTFYHHLPMTYMAGILNSFILPLVCGSKIVIGPRFSIAQAVHFWDLPTKEGVNVFWFVPTMLALLLKLGRNTANRPLMSSRNVIGCVGTAPLSKQIHNDFENSYGIPLYESYGLSETLFISTQSPSADDGAGSVGKVLPGVMVKEESDGELSLGADWMFRGYVQNKKEDIFTCPAFVSGDLGEINSDGYLHITGRKKDIIIRGGTNISPRRIEEFCNERMVFEECTIVGFPDPILGERIVCFYVTHSRGFSDADHEALLTELRTQLGKEYAIDEFFPIKVIPKNTNGKVNKLALRSLYKKI